MMKPGKQMRRWLLLLTCVCTAELATAGGAASVHNGTVAGGGGTSQAGQYTLIWTIGEPAMGTTSNGQFRLTSGFPAMLGDLDVQGGPADGRIFADGFED